MLQKILTFLFYILFFLTPLTFLKYNSELFEYNKMMLVYGLTVLIGAVWLLQMIHLKQFIWKKTPLDLPILFFLISQILSTVFSIDRHTSFWGYYSRSNGGLFSIFSYILLYYALVSNFQAKQVFNFIKVALLGGLAVSLWAIPEHFGASASCKILVGKWSADCWVQDVQARVFATLGQPNWLAAYLGMLIFPALYFLLTAKTALHKTAYGILAILYYVAFTFTYSRGATIGLGFAFALFLTLQLFPFKNRWHLLRAIAWGWVLESIYRLIFDRKIFLKHILASQFIKPVFGALIIFILINLLFGSALTGNFKLLKENIASRPSIVSQTSVGTQLENGGTESGQIRLIVWKGALDIFLHAPILGSGVETFAYSYYLYRPVQHNNVSEWDFLYNKAHNEYLNYLSTTGLVGFLSYLFLIVSFIWWSITRMFKISNSKIDPENQLFILAILSSYIFYLVQNFFGFSVVIIALFFFVFPAFAFILSGSVSDFKLSKKYNFEFLNALGHSLTFKPMTRNISSFVVIIIAGLLLNTLINFWMADRFYKDGTDYSDIGNPGRAYNYLNEAVNLNKDEPLYHSELGYASAASSAALAEEDATTSAILKDTALSETNLALNISPANPSLWRTAIRTYYQLSIIDKDYEQKTIDTVDQTIKLAPTDPKLYYNKALILTQLGKTDEAITAFNKALELKPNYHEALFDLGVTYEQAGEIDKAKEQMEKILKFIPGEEGAIKKLKELATASAKPK